MRYMQLQVPFIEKLLISCYFDCPEQSKSLQLQYQYYSTRNVFAFCTVKFLDKYNSPVSVRLLNSLDPV